MEAVATKPRTVLVTGGGRGIGAAISRAFHAAGDRVIMASRSDAGIVVPLGARARYVPCDVRNADQLRAAVDAALAWSGRLDILINNAGYSRWSPLEAVEESFWDDMMATNLKSVFFASQAAARVLPRGGCIINVSSLAGKRGSANNSVYCATKFGVNGITQALAKELGPRGIRVNAVCPVYVKTPGLEEALAEGVSPTGGRDTVAYLAEFARTQSALGVLPTHDEVAEAVLFLASPQASAITGQCINVDCGVMPQ